MPIVTAGSTDLYYEVRGDGPPLLMIRSTPSPPHIAAIIDGLAQRLGADVAEIAATHTPYQDRPHELAEAIRSYFVRD